MKSSETKPSDDFRVDVGRANKGRTFVRVIHTPSGKERLLVGLDGSAPEEVANRLIKELKEELGK
jgi:hypothetical protein